MKSILVAAVLAAFSFGVQAQGGLLCDTLEAIIKDAAKQERTLSNDVMALLTFQDPVVRWTKGYADTYNEIARQRGAPTTEQCGIDVARVVKSVKR